MQHVLLDIQVGGDDRPYETLCSVTEIDGLLTVFYEITNCDITDRLSPDQLDECRKALKEGA